MATAAANRPAVPPVTSSFKATAPPARPAWGNASESVAVVGGRQLSLTEELIRVASSGSIGPLIAAASTPSTLASTSSRTPGQTARRTDSVASVASIASMDQLEESMQKLGVKVDPCDPSDCHWMGRGDLVSTPLSLTQSMTPVGSIGDLLTPRDLTTGLTPRRGGFSKGDLVFYGDQSCTIVSLDWSVNPAVAEICLSLPHPTTMRVPIHHLMPQTISSSFGSIELSGLLTPTAALKGIGDPATPAAIGSVGMCDTSSITGLSGINPGSLIGGSDSNAHSSSNVGNNTHNMNGNHNVTTAVSGLSWHSTLGDEYVIQPLTSSAFPMPVSSASTSISSALLKTLDDDSTNQQMLATGMSALTSPASALTRAVISPSTQVSPSGTVDVATTVASTATSGVISGTTPAAATAAAAAAVTATAESSGASYSASDEFHYQWYCYWQSLYQNGYWDGSKEGADSVLSMLEGNGQSLYDYSSAFAAGSSAVGGAPMYDPYGGGFGSKYQGPWKSGPSVTGRHRGPFKHRRRRRPRDNGSGIHGRGLSDRRRGPNRMQRRMDSEAAKKSAEEAAAERAKKNHFERLDEESIFKLPHLRAHRAHIAHNITVESGPRDYDSFRKSKMEKPTIDKVIQTLEHLKKIRNGEEVPSSSMDQQSSNNGHSTKSVNDSSVVGHSRRRTGFIQRPQRDAVSDRSSRGRGQKSATLRGKFADSEPRRSAAGARRSDQRIRSRVMKTAQRNRDQSRNGRHSKLPSYASAIAGSKREKKKYMRSAQKWTVCLESSDKIDEQLADPEKSNDKMMKQSDCNDQTTDSMTASESVARSITEEHETAHCSSSSQSDSVDPPSKAQSADVAPSSRETTENFANESASSDNADHSVTKEHSSLSESDTTNDASESNNINNDNLKAEGTDGSGDVCESPYLKSAVPSQSGMEPEKDEEDTELSSMQSCDATEQSTQDTAMSSCITEPSVRSLSDDSMKKETDNCTEQVSDLAVKVDEHGDPDQNDDDDCQISAKGTDVEEKKEEKVIDNDDTKEEEGEIVEQSTIMNVDPETLAVAQASQLDAEAAEFEFNPSHAASTFLPPRSYGLSSSSANLNGSDQSGQHQHQQQQQQSRKKQTSSHSIRDKGTLRKTEMCENFMRYGWCRYSEKCHFAHGWHEIKQRIRGVHYKTEPCCDPARADAAFCLFGSRCNFAHPGEEMRFTMRTDYTDSEYYSVIRSMYKEDYPFGIYL